MDHYNEAFAFLIARLILGFLFFFQSYEKIFRLNLSQVCSEVYEGTRPAGIPDGITKLSVYITSYIELIGGVLLIFGFFTNPVLYILGIHLVLLVVAFGYLKGIWDMKHISPRLALLILLLLLPEEWNWMSLDQWYFG